MSAIGLVLGLCLLGWGSGPSAWAAVYAGTPSTYRQLLRALKPGDTLNLAPGVYRQGLPIHFLNGTREAPIVVEGPKAGRPAVFRARPEHNTVSLVNSSYVTVRHLVLDGHGTGVDAVKAEGFRSCDWTHHITLEDLRIVGHGQHQQQVGISTKCPAWGWVIRNNLIWGAGTGIYLGNSDGNAPFFHGLIEHNLIADTLGYNLQIKHQLVRPQDLPEQPPATGVTVIRHNVFSKAGGHPGDAARPNVLVGHWPRAGAGIEDEYLIYGNLFYQNPTEALFQGEGNLSLYDNLFVNSHANNFPAIAIQPHNDIPRRVRIFHNTVVTRGKGIVVQGGSPCHQQTVAGNALFADLPLLTAGGGGGNLIAPYAEADAYLQRPFAEAAQLNLYPRPGRLRGGPDLEAEVGRLPDTDRDFNGIRRRQAFFGAYGGEGDNPGSLPGRRLASLSAL